VDDEKDIHILLRVHLGKVKDIEVMSAYSAEEAVKMYGELLRKGGEPSLVIMDLKLSGGDVIEFEGREKFDGVEATEKILKLNPKAVIWGYTAWEDTNEGKKLKEVGARQVFGRDISFKEFAKMVEKFFHG